MEKVILGIHEMMPRSLQDPLKSFFTSVVTDPPNTYKLFDGAKALFETYGKADAATFALWAAPYAYGAVALFLHLSDKSTKPKAPTKSPDPAQLKAFNYAIKRAYETHQPVIVTGYRGQGKTTTAIAAASSSNAITARYIDGKAISENELVSEAELRINGEWKRFRTGSWGVWLPPALWAGVVIFTPLAQWKKCVHVVAVITMGTLVVRLHRAPDVLIVDDLSQHLLPTDGETKMEAYTKLLEGLKPPVVIVSSNEGIAECFVDVAPLNRRPVPLPDPSLATLEKNLEAIWLESPPKAKAVTAAQGGSQTANTTTGIRSHVEGGTPAVPTAKTVVEKACERLPAHHSRSMRWWPLFTKAELEQWAAASPTTTLPRAKLFEVVALLDLTTQEPARAITLGCSPTLTVEEVDQLRVAVGGSEEVFKKNFPQRCPRRLGLTWALALTAKENEEKGFKRMVRILKSSRSEKENNEVILYHYEESIEPLVAKLTELVNQKRE